MVYRVACGIFLLLAGLTYLGIAAIPQSITGVFALVAGIALLAGV